MSNYAKFFPILKYQNGVLTRINGSGDILAGEYALFPLLSVDQRPFLEVDPRYYFRVNEESVINVKIKSLTADLKGVPDPCFLVATRRYTGYSIEEVESLNKIWNDLMSKLWKLKLKNLMKTL